MAGLPELISSKAGMTGSAHSFENEGWLSNSKVEVFLTVPPLEDLWKWKSMKGKLDSIRNGFNNMGCEANKLLMWIRNTKLIHQELGNHGPFLSI